MIEQAILRMIAEEKADNNIDKLILPYDTVKKLIKEGKGSIPQLIVNKKLRNTNFLSFLIQLYHFGFVKITPITAKKKNGDYAAWKPCYCGKHFEKYIHTRPKSQRLLPNDKKEAYVGAMEWCGCWPK